MNTLTVEEIASGAGIFEGRYAQTLAQGIVDLRNEQREHMEMLRADGRRLDALEGQPGSRNLNRTLIAALDDLYRWEVLHGGHRMNCVSVSTPQIRCSCGWADMLHNAAKLLEQAAS